MSHKRFLLSAYENGEQSNKEEYEKGHHTMSSVCKDSFGSSQRQQTIKKLSSLFQENSREISLKNFKILKLDIWHKNQNKIKPKNCRVNKTKFS